MSEWLRDRMDRRVIAALDRNCPACGCKSGELCGWRIGVPERFELLKTGLVHSIRVPEAVLFGTQP